MPLGYKDGEKYYLYNHIDLFIKLALVPNKDQTYHVVGFAMEPKSINYEKLEKHESGGAHKIDVR